MQITSLGGDLRSVLRDMGKAWEDSPHRKQEWLYSNAFDYVARRGHEYVSQPLTDDEWDLDQGVATTVYSRGRFPIQQCFYNSQRLIDADYTGTLQYVEGYTTSEACRHPLLHAWVTIEGKVVDVTMRLQTANQRRSARSGATSSSATYTGDSTSASSSRRRRRSLISAGRRSMIGETDIH